MRSSKNRSRSKSNRQRSIGNIINRVFDSSGPEGKVRGTPQQIIDKYLMLARDAQLSNDRVAEQNFLQHAEHYTRMLGEAQAELARDMAARQGQHGGGQGNGQQGGQQPRDRDYRGDEEGAPILTFDDGSDQPDIEDIGLVETPEAARQRRDEPRRDPQQQQQPRRDDRGERRRDDRGDRRNDRRDDRKDRDQPQSDAAAPAQVAEPVVQQVAEPAPPPAASDAPAKAPRSRSRSRKSDDAPPATDAPADTVE